MAATAVEPVAPAAPARVLVSRRPRRRLRELELWVPAGFLILLILACFVWPIVYPVPKPILGSALPNLSPLSHGHLFGTDQTGNDVFSRILYGGRVSLEVGFGSALLGLIVGGGLGALAAYYGGLLEAAVMRLLEIFLAFPSLVLAIVVASYLGPSEMHVIWAISFFTVPYFARLARANTLQVREQTYIWAAQIMGVRDWRTLLRHVAPNILPPLMTFGLLGVGFSIIIEAALSFLGLGVPPPHPSWGNMISQGQQNLATQPILVIIPSAFLFATVLAVNLTGDAIRYRWSTR
ncbi:MAG: ABC transporter permease [Acidimicrobiaceae bacterium]|nr:ABC transporter permease [Acidimicrobiaceae bacterium]